MYRGIFIATLILRIFQIIFFAPIVVADPDFFAPSIPPPNIAKNVSPASTLKIETTAALDKEKDSGTIGGKNIANEDKKDDLKAVVSDVDKGKTEALKNASLASVENGEGNKNASELAADGKNDGNVPEKNGENVNKKAEEPPTTDALDKMVENDEQDEGSFEYDTEEDQKKDEELNAKLSDAEMRNNLLADEDKEEKKEEDPIVAYNWTDGNGLTAKDAEKAQLLVRNNEKVLKYQASNPGPTKPIKLQIDGGKCPPVNPKQCPASANEIKNENAFKMVICKGKDKKKCDKGINICFPGEIDPLNSRKKKGTQQYFALSNINGLADVCKKELEVNEDWKKQWAGKELHGINIGIDENGKFAITASFTNETATVLTPMGEDECVILFVGNETGLFGGYDDAFEKMHDADKMAMEKLANGVPLKDLPLLSILPLDMPRRSPNKKIPLLAFVAEEEKCDVTVSFAGQCVKRCQDEECGVLAHETAAEIKRGVYGEEYKHLQPVLSPEQLPPQYAPFITFMLDDKTKEPKARISSNGDTEIIFAIATIGPVKPEFVAFRPPNAMHCTVKKNPEANEFVLIINGRPDCFMRFAWGERAFFFKDDMDDINRLVSTRDMPLRFGGRNEDAVYTVAETNEIKMLGNIPCSIIGHKILVPIPGMEEYDHLYYFVIYPQKGGTNTPRAKLSQCKIGIDINLTSQSLLVPNIVVTEKPTSEAPVTEKNGP